MKKILPFVVMLVAGYFAKDIFLGKPPAISYNNEIVEQQAKIIKKVLSLADGFKTRKAGELDSRLADLQDQIQESLAEVRKMDAFEGDTSLRDTAVKLFEFYESAADQEFHEICEILKKGDADITQADLDTMQEINQYINEEERALDAEFLGVQKEFASKHNIKLAPNALQKKINAM